MIFSLLNILDLLDDGYQLSAAINRTYLRCIKLTKLCCVAFLGLSFGPQYSRPNVKSSRQRCESMWSRRNAERRLVVEVCKYRCGPDKLLFVALCGTGIRAQIMITDYPTPVVDLGSPTNYENDSHSHTFFSPKVPARI